MEVFDTVFMYSKMQTFSYKYLLYENKHKFKSKLPTLCRLYVYMRSQI